ncbi:hypothetical protein AN963_25535 [Brevibacillus choshinensis]|uniref:Haloacid dehalogenase n=1 Tax=Brevibacillus choshinensis TaxID=54911 RepID=A0ABR5N2K6_BRECH|nr:hypothetical protein [Brevibacillus choshinensis]KQL44732.1 hypothetical protein AN963_25535 [Brevibacillus choshinensis]
MAIQAVHFDSDGTLLNRDSSLLAFVRDHRAVVMKAVWKRNELEDTVLEAEAIIDDLTELLPLVLPEE